MAWAAAYMLAEVPLPVWASGRRVAAVGGQTDRPVDDVGLITDDDGWVTIQAKKGLPGFPSNRGDFGCGDHGRGGLAFLRPRPAGAGCGLPGFSWSQGPQWSPGSRAARRAVARQRDAEHP